MTLMEWATRVPLEYRQYDAILKRGANHQPILMYELKAGTRLYEVGIPSNRASARRGEVYL
ncbi:hypothetical protein GCM10027084_28750 [Pseudoxanthomonas sangjuensis]